MDWLSGLFSAIGGFFNRAIDALRRIHFLDIWNAIKRGYSRIQSILQWYNDHVIQPWERLRAHMIAVYNHYFGPIIQMLDTIRSTVRIIGIFDAKLAASIDNALWKVESAIYAPLYAALKRINAVTSTLRAAFTALGLLDRSLLIQSCARDWKSLWRVLLNNGVLPMKLPYPPQVGPLRQMEIDLQQFAQDGSGPVADTLAAVDLQCTSAEQAWS